MSQTESRLISLSVVNVYHCSFLGVLELCDTVSDTFLGHSRDKILANFHPSRALWCSLGPTADPTSRSARSSPPLMACASKKLHKAHFFSLLRPIWTECSTTCNRAEVAAVSCSVFLLCKNPNGFLPKRRRWAIKRVSDRIKWWDLIFLNVNKYIWTRIVGAVQVWLQHESLAPGAGISPLERV